MSAGNHREADEVRAAVEAHWGLGPVALEPLPGGMNSATWTVTTRGGDPERRWVAKLVGRDQADGFARGLTAAIRVESVGIPAGAPEPRRDGRLTAEAADGVLALLRWVDGRPLSGAGVHDQALVGTVLGRVHRALRGAGAGTGAFPGWVDVDAGHLDVEGWIRPAVRGALERYADLAGTSLSEGLLHADPAPEAFVWSPAQRRCGLIDWSSAVHGPLLYDLASAVMYSGGTPRAGTLVRAYARTGAVPTAEITRGVEVMLRVRWAVQADYFARRLAADDRTGITDPSQNLAGLHDARDFFRSGG